MIHRPEYLGCRRMKVVVQRGDKRPMLGGIGGRGMWAKEYGRAGMGIFVPIDTFCIKRTFARI